MSLFEKRALHLRYSKHARLRVRACHDPAGDWSHGVCDNTFHSEISNSTVRGVSGQRPSLGRPADAELLDRAAGVRRDSGRQPTACNPSHGARRCASACGCRCTAAERRDSLVLHQPVTALAAASASHGARSVTALATAAIMTRIPHEAVLNPRPGPPLPQPCAPKCRDASRHGRRRPCRWCLYHASHYTKHYIMRRLLDANYATHYATAALPWRHPHRQEAFSNGSLTADRPGRRLGGRGAVDGREPEVGDSDAAAPGA